MADVAFEAEVAKLLKDEKELAAFDRTLERVEQLSTGDLLIHWTLIAHTVRQVVPELGRTNQVFLTEFCRRFAPAELGVALELMYGEEEAA